MIIKQHFSPDQSQLFPSLDAISRTKCLAKMSVYRQPFHHTMGDLHANSRTSDTMRSNCSWRTRR